MMRNITISFFILLLFLFDCIPQTYALSVETHEKINEDISSNTVNGFSLDIYLKNTLGFNDGKDEFINGKEVYKWLRDGGRYEDVPPWTIIPYLRSINHFHNPLKAWNEAGLNDTFTGTSSVIWAQDQSSAGLLLGGDWSWKKAREYFYIALTGKDFSGNLVATDKTQRDAYFAKTFRANGQLMHLVEDASVPAHVRNNSHILEEGYEEWVEDTRKYNQGLWSSLTATPLPFDSSILNETPNPLAPIPIAKIFDTDKYAEGITPSTSLSWGIAEYANANFASHDTIFTENFDYNHKYYFPYPKYSTQNYQMYDIDIPPDKKRIYLRKIGDGEHIDHFATAGPLYKYLSFDPVLQRDELKLDSTVHADYAQKLIPRAVGYSAGLLNYFFRGQIDMVPDDVTGSGYVIVNNTDEDMDGSFELWYDNSSDQRVQAWSNSLSISKVSSGNNKSTNITFSSPTDAKEPGKYILVFRGQLGNEDNAVVGKLTVQCVPAYEVDGGHVIAGWDLRPLYFTDDPLEECQKISLVPTYGLPFNYESWDFTCYPGYYYCLPVGTVLNRGSQRTISAQLGDVTFDGNNYQNYALSSSGYYSPGLCNEVGGGFNYYYHTDSINTFQNYPQLISFMQTPKGLYMGAYQVLDGDYCTETDDGKVEASCIGVETHEVGYGNATETSFIMSKSSIKTKIIGSEYLTQEIFDAIALENRTTPWEYATRNHTKSYITDQALCGSASESGTRNISGERVDSLGFRPYSLQPDDVLIYNGNVSDASDSQSFVYYDRCSYHTIGQPSQFSSFKYFYGLAKGDSENNIYYFLELKLNDNYDHFILGKRAHGILKLVKRP